MEMDNPAVQGDEIDDTTCTFSTNPRQPTNYLAVMASAAGVIPALPAVTADPVTKATMASVSNGDSVSNFPTSLVHGTEGAMVVVNSAASDEVPTDDVPAEGTGSFTLTITCRDGETSVVGSSTIVVANYPYENGAVEG